MRKIVWAVVVAWLPVLSIVVASQQQAGRDPSWAFPVINGALPAEEPGPKSVPGSTRNYTPVQIDDLLNPPDWFRTSTLPRRRSFKRDTAPRLPAAPAI